MQADQSQQRDADVHVHVKQVPHQLTGQRSHQPLVSVQVVENPEGQACQEDQIRHSAVDEEDAHGVTAGAQKEEHPQGSEVPHKAKDEEERVDYCQRQTEVWVLHHTGGGLIVGGGGRGRGDTGGEEGRHWDGAGRR